MRKLWILFVVLAGAAAFAEEPAAVSTTNGTVSVTSKGNDVRVVLHDLFTQANKNFVLEQSVRRDLYLALSGVDFDESLQIICKAADLTYEQQNGIYYLSKSALSKTGPKGPPALKPVPEKPKGRLPETVLTKKFTTRLSKTDFRKIIAEIARQTNVRLEVSGDVKSYLLDAYLIDTSLKYGLDMLTTATGLQYKFTDEQSILIFKPNPNRVTVLGSN